MSIVAFERSNPPVPVAAALLHDVLVNSPRRIALAGRAGAGKTTIARIITGAHPALGGPPWLAEKIPVFNHADGIKDEVLEWAANARKRGLIPGHDATFDDFCNFLGITPSIVRLDLMEIVGPCWQAMSQLLETVYDEQIPVMQWAGVPIRQATAEKVAFIEQYKPVFRSALQTYGQAIKEIGANPQHWVEWTVERGMAHRLWVNADSRFAEEMHVLRGTGWTGVYLQISDETQRERRPEMTGEQLLHVSEHGIGPRECDCVIDANQPLGMVIMELATALAATRPVRRKERARR